MSDIQYSPSSFGAIVPTITAVQSQESEVPDSRDIGGGCSLINVRIKGTYRSTVEDLGGTKDARSLDGLKRGTGDHPGKKSPAILCNIAPDLESRRKLIIRGSAGATINGNHLFINNTQLYRHIRLGFRLGFGIGFRFRFRCDIFQLVSSGRIVRLLLVKIRSRYRGIRSLLRLFDGLGQEHRFAIALNKIIAPRKKTDIGALTGGNPASGRPLSGQNQQDLIRPPFDGEQMKRVRAGDSSPVNRQQPGGFLESRKHRAKLSRAPTENQKFPGRSVGDVNRTGTTVHRDAVGTGGREQLLPLISSPFRRAKPESGKTRFQIRLGYRCHLGLFGHQKIARDGINDHRFRLIQSRCHIPGHSRDGRIQTDDPATGLGCQQQKFLAVGGLKGDHLGDLLTDKFGQGCLQLAKRHRKYFAVETSLSRGLCRRKGSLSRWTQQRELGRVQLLQRTQKHHRLDDRQAAQQALLLQNVDRCAGGLPGYLGRNGEHPWIRYHHGGLIESFRSDGPDLRIPTRQVVHLPGGTALLACLKGLDLFGLNDGQGGRHLENLQAGIGLIAVRGRLRRDVGQNTGTTKNGGQVNGQVALDPDNPPIPIGRGRNHLIDEFTQPLSRLQNGIETSQHHPCRLNRQDRDIGGQLARVQDGHPGEKSAGGGNVGEDGPFLPLGRTGDRSDRTSTRQAVADKTIERR